MDQLDLYHLFVPARHVAQLDLLDLGSQVSLVFPGTLAPLVATGFRPVLGCLVPLVVQFHLAVLSVHFVRLHLLVQDFLVFSITVTYKKLSCVSNRPLKMFCFGTDFDQEKIYLIPGEPGVPACPVGP